MKIKNINPNIRYKIAAFALVGTLAITSLVGCGIVSNTDKTKPKVSANKAIILNENCATIVEIEHWELMSPAYKIFTIEGLVFYANSDNTYLLDTRNSEISAEEMARSLVGEEGEINYLNSEKNKTK